MLSKNKISLTKVTFSLLPVSLIELMSFLAVIPDYKEQGPVSI